MTRAPPRQPSDRNPPLAMADYRALGAFRHALRKFLAFSEARARELGLSPQQHQALLAVKVHAGTDAISIGELAERLMIKNHSAVGLVARLADRGLLTRAASAEDRRRVLLALTPEGDALVADICRKNLGELHSSAPALAELMSALKRLHRGVPSR